MKKIVVYQSKTGFTKKYAKWITDALHCQLVDIKAAKPEMLAPYDIIIFGSYVRIEKIHGYDNLKKLIGDAGKKNLVLFATGAGDPEPAERIEAVWKKSVPENELNEIPHFYMVSGLNYQAMSLGEKISMKLFAFMMKRKNKGKEAGGAGKDMSKSYDASSKKYIVPLINYVKGLSK